jgi:Ca2+:H+ antiporter
MAALSKLERVLLCLVVLVAALAGVADHIPWPTVPRFIVATVALAGVAWVVSFATEQVGRHYGSAIAGMLQATLGNLPELFVVVFALQKAELVIAQTALVGSILANALLVLGLVIVVGAHQASDGVMRFGKRLPNDTTTLMLVTVFIIVLLGLSLGSHDPASHHVQAISAVGAGCLLLVYLSWAIPYVRWGSIAVERAPEVAAGEQGPGEPGPGELGPGGEPGPRGLGTGGEPGPRLSNRAALAMLILAGAISAFVSSWFVDALTPAIATFHISQAFAGLVIVAIAGNAVEHVSGIALAWRGRSNMAISVVKNSVAQIAAFVFPVLVLISFALSTTLTFALAPVYVGALALTAVAVWQVTGDGETAAFEGWALVALYVVVAVVAAFE